MDLAKIRQKALHDRKYLQSEELAAGKQSVRLSLLTESAPSAFESLTDTFVPAVDVPVEQPHASNHDVPPVFTAGSQQVITVETGRKVLPPVRDPLAVILAGRAAAGCDEDLPLASSEQEGSSSVSYMEFLCFRVSDELYGINIMDIKEIIKPRETTEVPRSPSFVSGVISLRGTIIPIIDMLDRLGLSRDNITGRERVIVVRLKDTMSGLMVDEIVQVVRIPMDCMEAAPAILDGIDRDFVSGIGRADGNMIIILNLESIADINLF